MRNKLIELKWFGRVAVRVANQLVDKLKSDLNATTKPYEQLKHKEDICYTKECVVSGELNDSFIH